MTRRTLPLLSCLFLALLVACGGSDEPEEVVRAPDAPTGVVAVAHDGSATVSWTAPADDGGSNILRYTVTAHPGGAHVTVEAPATTATVEGLANGTAYTFTVVATNAKGDSPASEASAPVTPLHGLPGAPTGVSATAGDGRAVVSWVAPADDGGHALISYTVTADPGGAHQTVDAATQTATVDGLTNDTAYTFTVVATNSVGDGPASEPSSPVTPSAALEVPGAPTHVVATVTGVGKVHVSWSAPADDGGSPVLGYRLTRPNNSPIAEVGPVTEVTLDRSPGVGISFVVVAFNAVGEGERSEASNTVTPPNVVDPTYTTLSVTPSSVLADGSATLTLTVSAFDIAGRPVPGASVTLSSNQASDMFSASSGSTGAGEDANQFVATVSATRGGPRTFTAQVDAVTVTASAAFDAPVCSGTPLFDGPPTENAPLGLAPTAVAAGDFDEDGIPDLAVTNSTDDDVSVILSVGEGVLGTPVHHAVGMGPSDVTVADVNEDGHLDVLTVNYNNSNVSVLIGHGDGTFEPASPVATGGSVSGMVTGDFNGDGHLDLAMNGSSSDHVLLVLGAGDGSFATTGDFFEVGTEPLSIAAGDFNGDGHLDVATANYGSNDVSVLLGDGTGSFGTATPYAVGSGPQSIVALDIGVDGALDLAVANTGSSGITYLFNDGTGAFAPSSEFDRSDAPNHLVAGDFNRDGASDLIVTSRDATEVNLIQLNDVMPSAPAPSAGVTQTVAATAADFDADGKLDLALVSFDAQTVSLLLQTGCAP